MMRRGMTLVEVLIAAGLLSVLLTVAITLLWGTLPAWRQAERQRVVFQNAVSTVDGLARMFRQVRRIDAPSWSQLDAEYAPVAGKTQPIIVTLPDGLMAITWNPTSAQVEGMALTHIPAPDDVLPAPRRIAGPCGPLKLQRMMRSGVALLRIQVACQDGKLLPVETAIRLDPRTLQDAAP